MWRVNSLEKTLMLGGIGGRRRRGRQRMRWLGGIMTWWTWVWVNSGSWWWTGRPGMLWFMGSQRVGHDWAIEMNWTELNWTECYSLYSHCIFAKTKKPPLHIPLNQIWDFIRISLIFPLMMLFYSKIQTRVFIPYCSKFSCFLGLLRSVLVSQAFLIFHVVYSFVSTSEIFCSMFLIFIEYSSIFSSLDIFVCFCFEGF